MVRLKPGTKVETAHGRHHAHERGVVVGYQFTSVGPGWTQDWYQVDMDCGCCKYSFDMRSDGYGRIRKVTV